MKGKKIFQRITTIGAVAALMMSLSASALAQTNSSAVEEISLTVSSPSPTVEPTATPVPTTEESSSQLEGDSPRVTSSPSPTPESDATNDANVVEETEDSPALTPEGNAALVDDFGGNKQLITVTTKAGNYFYILIDRANEDKETAVHFLNQVDEADLEALMEDGETAEETPAVCNCTEKCAAGAVNTACPVCAVNMAECTGQEPEPTPAPETDPEPEQEPAGLNPAILLVVLAVLGGIGALVYFKFIKQKPKTKGSDNLDDYDYGEDEELPEDETWETEPEDADGGGDEESENPAK